MADRCKEKTIVYARVCGFYTPVKQWNKGKTEEFKERTHYDNDGKPIRRSK